MLAKDSSLTFGTSLFASLTEDVERSQDVVVIRVHLKGLPVIAILVHDIGESRILIIERLRGEVGCEVSSDYR